MIKHIYVTGDSFSFGQGLGGPADMAEFYNFTPYMRQHSYTGIIADSWGIKGYTNTSSPGGSNDRILRMITTDLPTLFKTIDPKEIFVFVSMTHAARREFYDRRSRKYSPFIPNHRPPRENKAVTALWESYVLNFNSPCETSARYLTQILSIQGFLKTLGINYLITRSMNDDNEFISNMNSLPPEVLSLIDKKTFPDILPFNVYSNSISAPFSPCYHPLEEGHIAWAKYLTDYMKSADIGVL